MDLSSPLTYLLILGTFAAFIVLRLVIRGIPWNEVEETPERRAMRRWLPTLLLGLITASLLTNMALTARYSHNTPQQRLFGRQEPRAEEEQIVPVRGEEKGSSKDRAPQR